MMEAICQYILSIICASLISGILADLSEKTYFSRQVKLISSLFLAVTFLKPLITWQFHGIEQISDSFSLEAQAAVREGDQLRIRSVAGIIKAQAETYILQEARSIGADISVEIGLGFEDPPIPVSSTIRGCFDASCESTLSRMLTKELGIPKERQTWIRQESRSGSS